MSVEENREIRPVRKKRKLRWGRLVFVLLVLAVLLTGAFWGTVWIYDNFINPPKVDVVGASDKITQNEKLNKRINILLLGIDDGDSEAAPDEPKRTDAMMLASFDPGDNKVALLSMPRDTKVQIPGRGWDKLNAAYAYGGVMMAKQKGANLLQGPIHYYVLVDWRAFIDVIDLIGGIMKILTPILLLILNMVISIWTVNGQANMCGSAKMSWVILAACKGSRSL